MENFFSCRPPRVVKFLISGGNRFKDPQRVTPGEILMGQFLYLYLIGLIAVFAAAAFVLFRLKFKTKAKGLPEHCMGAIRVTDRQGRNMLIIRKEDGSFEMCEEKQVPKQ
jgi:hypothetical protein